MLPRLIQGGMGIGVSGWPLAREVSSLGQLGVVSGTALDSVFVRRLAGDDPGGHLHRAIAAFPIPDIAKRVIARYVRPGVPLAAGDGPGEGTQKSRYRLLPLLATKVSAERNWLLVLANFVEVYLAKEGHSGVVGINYLRKLQLPLLPSIYGAMLAGVDVVLMGAGIPGEIPALLDKLAQHADVQMAIDGLDVVEGGKDQTLQFSPGAMWKEQPLAQRPVLSRPKFLAIVASATLARSLLKRAPGGIDGFVIEEAISGGHNAPPRGPQQLTAEGEPIYGARDVVDLALFREMGVPFWLAGGYASRAKVDAAVAAGARGVQVGTAFAFCEESGLEPGLRRKFLQGVLGGQGHVFTDPAASPTTFPFKVATVEGTLSDENVFAQRPRLCDLGYLRTAFRKPDGAVGFRCPAEPVEDYVHKGGKESDTAGRKCLCNGLMANVGLGQRRAGILGGGGYEEPPLLTAGSEFEFLRQYITPSGFSYHARDVIASLLPAR